MMYYILQKDVMQIMNLDKLAKDFWWALTASSTIDKLPDSIIFTDTDGNIQHFNRKAQEVFGLVYEEFKTEKFDNIIIDGVKHVRESLESSKPVLATAIVAGREFYVELNATRKGEGYCVSVRDLTKLTGELVNEEKIAKFNCEKNAMLAKLEGDLKSPLTSISGFSKGLLDGLGGNLSEKQTKYVKIINSNAEELYHFMDKLLEFSKAESSIYESVFHNFDIIEALKSVAKEFESVFAEKKLTFDINYECISKRNIFSDSNAIKSAFRNILDVAISMTETGVVLVKLSIPDDETCLKYNLGVNPESYLQITIRDTGVGIAEDEMKYLCEPYAQLEKGKKNFLRSLELGTATIMIKRADGIIDIYSEVMKGTEYSIILPIEKV